jgi:NAD(P)-dependent dehydrogenase (short-subunit alcohol dehydrogenase family)
MPESSPTDRVALVTGSGRKRVGWHVADALADRGYRIAVHYRRSAKEAGEAVAHFRSKGVEAEAFGADLADEGAVSGLFRSALGRFGRLDVLVNCAAIWERKRLEEVVADDVRRHLVPLTAIRDRKSYAAAVNDFASSIWHFAMTFATDFEVQLNG